MGSLEVLDVLLAIEAKGPFEVLQGQLVETVKTNWNEWPAFTKASVLSCLRCWFWSTFPQLRNILTTTLQRESESVVLRYAIERVVQFCCDKAMPEMWDFLERASKGGHDESLEQLSRAIGHNYVASGQDSRTEGVAFLRSAFERALAMEWEDASSLASFLHGSLIGATEYLRSHPSDFGDLVDSWIDTMELCVAKWPFDRLLEVEGKFPVTSLLASFDMKHAPGGREDLLWRLGHVFDAIVRSGDLPAYCDLHFGLRQILEGKWRTTDGSRRQEEGIAITPAVEDVLLMLCRSSVEQVVEWNRQSKVTDDLGWRSAIDGRDSAELLKLSLGLSRDKPRMKRELSPLVDQLADLGFTNLAAGLRAEMRRTT